MEATANLSSLEEVKAEQSLLAMRPMTLSCHLHHMTSKEDVKEVTAKMLSREEVANEPPLSAIGLPTFRSPPFFTSALQITLRLRQRLIHRPGGSRDPVSEHIPGPGRNALHPAPPRQLTLTDCCSFSNTDGQQGIPLFCHGWQQLSAMDRGTPHGLRHGRKHLSVPRATPLAMRYSAFAMSGSNSRPRSMVLHLYHGERCSTFVKTREHGTSRSWLRPTPQP